MFCFMDLKTIVERARRSFGIETLLPMQREMSHIALPSRVLLQAPTGSGKTLAFAIVLLRALSVGTTRSGANVSGAESGTTRSVALLSGVKALVIAPTRELALQIFDTVRPLAAPDFKTAVLYGGHSFETEAKSLAGNPDIVIGTPGRLLDHMNRRRLELSQTGVLVIDEYDKALELGFASEMRRISGAMKRVSTLVLTSATSGEIPDFVGYVDSTLDYREPDCGSAAVEAYEVRSASADKLESLGELTKVLSGRKTMVFVNHREAAERVYAYLKKLHVDCCLYHGGLEQDVRERALILFANGTARVMVSTDLAARGLDIEGVEAVVHYHLPSTAESWTHRNGRTGRLGGVDGDVYVLVSEKDVVPDYVKTRKGEVSALPRNVGRLATLYFNAGKKDKISRGDIAGYLISKGGLAADEVGRIDVKDRCAYVAVPAEKARATVEAVLPYKIKNTKVKVSVLSKW